MKQVVLKFISAILVTSILIELASRVALKRAWISAAPSFSILIIAALALVTLVLFAFLQDVQKSNPQKFLQRYLLSITVKMVVGCALILTLIFIDKESAMANALIFIASYFSFTAIEIFFLLKGKTTH